MDFSSLPLRFKDSKLINCKFKDSMSEKSLAIALDVVASPIIRT